MRELIEALAPHTRILDLGAGPGSFTPERGDVSVIRLDLAVPAGRKGGAYVVADAAAMPFLDGAFDLIVSNHSLEHFTRLEATLREVARTIRPHGALFIAVPDAGTLTDRIYRWLGRGGGHVNAFRSPEEVTAIVERITGLQHRCNKELYSSLSFLNNHNFVAPPPRRIALFAFGNERFLAVLMWLLRGLDRRMGTQLSRYGWAFYFGDLPVSVAREVWVNVCVRCGSGHSEAYLRKEGCVRRGVLRWYRCPECGGFNYLSGEG